MSHNEKNEAFSSDDDEESGEEEEQIIATQRAKVEEETSSDEEDSETDNEAQRVNRARRKEHYAPSPRKAAHPNLLVGKRGREVGGKDEEPALKRSKDVKGEKPKASSTKAAPSVRSNGAQVSKSKLDNLSKHADVRMKRKASPPPQSKGRTKQAGDSADKSSSLKAMGKAPFSWSDKLEMALAEMLWEDRKHGRPTPSGKKNDPYWKKLVKEMSSEGIVITESQLSEKVRRMRNKWKTIQEKNGHHIWKSTHEHDVNKVWDRIWGTGVDLGKHSVRPGSSHVAAIEEDDSSEEEDVCPQAAGTNRVSLAQPSEKGESSELEEEIGRKKGSGSSTERRPFSPKSVLSPFASKSRLAHTPVVSEDKKKARKAKEASIAEENDAEESAEDDDGDGRISTAGADFLSSLKKESFSVIQEVRGSCLDALNNMPNQTGDFKMSSSEMRWLKSGTVPSVVRSFVESLMSTGGSSLATELEDEWKQLIVEEMEVLEKRLQLTLRLLQLARYEFHEQEI
ncbi:hypothetical protein R1flu_018434 [Riccia fluitans]|uniref:Uncharacterized protein n=1 Tax=Riccia fluitans TaxID=41844 RepID=A0ABD1ZHA6_9MARC